MIKLFFLMIFFFMGTYSLKASEALGGNDQEFTAKLDNIKNPFEDGIPKPIPVVVKPREVPKPIYVKPKPEPGLPQVVVLPALELQGVILGEDINQAIINGQVVPLGGIIKGARLDSVSKDEVELSYNGKKFFLKVK